MSRTIKEGKPVTMVFGMVSIIIGHARFHEYEYSTMSFGRELRMSPTRKATEWVFIWNKEFMKEFTGNDWGGSRFHATSKNSEAECVDRAQEKIKREVERKAARPK